MCNVMPFWALEGDFFPISDTQRIAAARLREIIFGPSGDL